jgi:4-hydroxymandelate oxidase
MDRRARRSGAPRRLNVDLAALEEAARTALSPGLRAYIAGGSEDEATLAANEQAWRRLRLHPRVLRDVTTVSTRTSSLGAELAAPIGVAPMGMQHQVRDAGLSDTARAAAASGALMVVPLYGAGSASAASAAAAGASGPVPPVLWLQVYLLKDRARSIGAIQRLLTAGMQAVVLTVDVTRPGNRPALARDQVVRTDPESGEIVDPAEFFDRAITPDDVGWLAQQLGVPLLVKGVLRGDDAAACIDAGAAGVIVSNHGGRQLDGAVASADALPEVVRAVDGRGEVWVDGGVRRGRHVLSALALGARGVLLGRPVIWGLAAGGAAGVGQVLTGCMQELERAMALCGVRSIDEITPDLVFDGASA